MSNSDHLHQSYKFCSGQFTPIPLHGRTVKNNTREIQLTDRLVRNLSATRQLRRQQYQHQGKPNSPRLTASAYRKPAFSLVKLVGSPGQVTQSHHAAALSKVVEAEDSRCADGILKMSYVDHENQALEKKNWRLLDIILAIT
jgi:hypothetical protein